MGCTAPKETKQQEPIRILCLGIGGCGKTTFVRQLKIIHQVGFNPIETERFSQIIRRNYLLTLDELIHIAAKRKLNFSEENQKHLPIIKELTRDREASVKENLPVLRSVWEDPVTQEIVQKHREQLSAPHIDYFWEHIDRILEDNYSPSDEDILRVRVRTAGAYSTVIYLKPEYFEFFDVGGQKPERSKWEKVLQSHEFSCILYFVACDEWDVKDEEREFEYSKLHMSKIIFNEVTEDPNIPKSVPVILFLNRSDLFEARIKSDEGFESFQKSYPEYTGSQNVEQAMEEIRKKFLTGIKRESVKYYVTNALDGDSMNPVFNAVKSYILTSALETTGVEY